MKTISLKIDELVFEETEKILSTNKKPRNKYINEALEYYNRIQKRLLLEQALKKESEAVRISSEEILKELEDIDDEI